MSAGWEKAAGCAAPGVDTGLFFAPHGETQGEREVREAEAIAVCRRCPVRTDCLEAGLGEKHGVWGGLGEDARHARHRRLVKRSRTGGPRTEDGTEVRRILQAMAAAGWSTAEIAQRTGVARSTLTQIRVGGVLQVWVATADAIRAAVPRLLRATPPELTAPRVRREARRRGWLPIAAWAGVDMADPAAAPNDTAHQLAA